MKDHEINEKIAREETIILTAAELKSIVCDGQTITLAMWMWLLQDIWHDVRYDGSHDGTFAEKCGFEEADSIWLNGVPAQPGPCPNERLGVVDLIIHGTSSADDLYGGEHLFRDLVNGKEIYILVEAYGRTYENKVTLEDLDFARIITTRLAFKNYHALINPTATTISFSVTGLTGPFTETSVSECGEINPLQNDPSHRIICTGTRVLLMELQDILWEKEPDPARINRMFRFLQT